MSVEENAVPVRGAPCWMHLMVSDLRGAEAFYASVLGWDFGRSTLGEGYSTALVDGRPVAGIGVRTPGWDQAAVWTPYFAVDDADLTAARVRERMATVAVGPLRKGRGRAALASDRDGAVFGFWEGPTPAWAVGEGSAPPRLELLTRDVFEAAIFYGEVFSWPGAAGGIEVVYEDERVVVRVSGRPVALLYGGAVERDPDPRIRPRWVVHFDVDDTERAAACAVDAGGTATPAVPGPGAPGPGYVIRDPEGGLFTVSPRVGR
ncbi:VOC family protein [Streptomyces sp. B1I3]|uniref:VOC family protein n=1 Tax=Streptomyces sp. B1I3 TaxID=3042264 RepID=UPI0027877D2F|nr:VOC family protein [Streptomyces sp. B1I3]MDQ0797843.1 putative enzyme related to lactoylglutathione lyase [Streptomyces sp. B1I3]